MDWVNNFIARLRALFRRDVVLDEIDEEMRAHIEMEAEANRGLGMTADEARLSAAKSFGNLGSIRDLAYEVKGGGVVETLWRDVRYSGRLLLKHPGFALIAVLTLALGIGANTAIFSIVNAVLLRPFPYENPDRLFMVGETLTGARDGAVLSYPNFADWRDDRNVFASASAVRPNENFNLSGLGEPERLQGRLVSAGFLTTLGIKPLYGRDFLAEDDRPGVTPTVILSYGLWSRLFANDPNIVGRQITLNNQSYTVVAVTPPEFRFGLVGLDADVSVPIGLSAERFKARGADPGIGAVARLKPGMSQEQAETALNLVYAHLEQQYPDSNARRRAYLTPLHEFFVGSVRTPLLILLGSVALVLLIACANVANLLLVRASGRKREISVRVALGASRGRIVRQLLTESFMLAFIGAVLGVLIARWGTGIIAHQLPDSIPRLSEANVDLRVLAFTLGASIITGLFFGLAPALQASRLNLTDALKEGDRGSSGRQRLRGALVIGEVALTLTLLIAASLLIQSFRRVLQVDPGFNPEHLLTMQVSVNNPDGHQVAAFFNQVQENVRRLPGVKSVAISNGLPLVGANHPTFFITGRPLPQKGTEPVAVRYTVSPDYFQTMGIQLVKGRVFTVNDTPNSPSVVLIDEALAQQHFQSEDPIGKHLAQSPSGTPSYEIIGVVRHVEDDSLEQRASRAPQFYLSFNQIPPEKLPGFVRRINVLTRTDVEPTNLASAVRREIVAVNKDQAVFNVRTMEDIVSESVAPRRFSMALLTVFAVVALALASIGIYGMLSYSVAQRTREIGLRMTLGAQRHSVLKLVIGHGMKLALIGVALGLVAAIALTRTMKNLLFGISATDPMTFIAISLLLAFVALLACWLPARRATKVDPMVALRYE